MQRETRNILSNWVVFSYISNPKMMKLIKKDSDLFPIYNKDSSKYIVYTGTYYGAKEYVNSIAT